MHDFGKPWLYYHSDSQRQLQRAETLKPPSPSIWHQELIHDCSLHVPVWLSIGFGGSLWIFLRLSSYSLCLLKQILSLCVITISTHPPSRPSYPPSHRRSYLLQITDGGGGGGGGGWNDIYVYKPDLSSNAFYLSSKFTPSSNCFSVTCASKFEASYLLMCSGNT